VGDVGSYSFMDDPAPAGEPPESTPPEPPGTRSELDRLLDLQEMDLSIDRLQSRLDVLETQEDLHLARSRLSDAESRLGELKLSIDEVARTQRRLESDVDSMERKVEAERKRLFDGSVANARELQSIEAEITSITGRKTRTEDELLDHMERREQLESGLAALDGEVTELRQRLTEIEEGSARELVDIERALAERNQERAGLAERIDPDLLTLYEDLRRQKKRVGVAALVGGICQGCHQALSPVYLDKLRRSNEIWRCEYCRRILVPRSS
jgi:predicted  nucleic acid-binding Zn-ribbon protein